MSLLPTQHLGWRAAGHSRRPSQASSALGQLACCVAWFLASEDRTKPPVEHWCRRHRKGHELVESFGLNISQQCMILKHRMTGHFARLTQDSLAHNTLVARDLGLWRYAQAAHAKLKDNWGGVHSQRFNVWRWETPLESLYGRVSRNSNGTTTSKGWLLRAQDRVAWKRDECAFAAQKD